MSTAGGYPSAGKTNGRILADAMPNPAPSIPVMSFETVQRICIEKSMFADPALNDRLFLNYKGFRHIAGLELYSNVKSLYLDNNGITDIEGIDRMTKLVSLWLQDNAITQIKNLEHNVGLRQLNLSGNGITRVENLKHLVELNQLNLSKNGIMRIGDIQEIKELPALRNFDMSHNCMDEAEGVIEFFADCPSLVLLRLNGNQGISNISHYRKRMVNAMPKLNYLDDRPVFEVEKRSCAAWANGGHEAMHKAKRDYNKEREDQCRVDQDRKQLLTDRRNQAIARMDREQREREEQAAKLAEAGSKPSSEFSDLTAVQKGDEKAVEDYERKWGQKLDLYGQEALLAQASEQSQGKGPQTALQEQHAAAMEAIRKAQRDATKASSRPHGEEMRPRQEAYQEQPLRQDMASQLSDMGEPLQVKGRAATVSDFRVSDAGNNDEGRARQEISVMDRLDSREQAVWNTPWNMGKQKTQSPAPNDANASNDDEVVPDIWRMNNARTGAEQSAIMDQNMRNMAAAQQAEKSKKSVQSTPVVSSSELNDLD